MGSPLGPKGHTEDGLLFFNRKGDQLIGDNELVQLPDTLPSSPNLSSSEEPFSTRLEYAPTMPLLSSSHPILSALDSNTIPTLSLDESTLELERTFFATSEPPISTTDAPSPGNSNHIDVVPITQGQN